MEKRSTKHWNLYKEASVTICSSLAFGIRVFVSPGGDQRPQIDDESIFKIVKPLKEVCAIENNEMNDRDAINLIALKKIFYGNEDESKSLPIGIIFSLAENLMSLANFELIQKLAETLSLLNTKFKINFEKNGPKNIIGKFIIVCFLLVDMDDVSESSLEKLTGSCRCIFKQTRSLFKYVIEEPIVLNLGKLGE